MSLVMPASGRPRACSACSGPLASCSALGAAGVAEPGAQALLGRLVEGGDVEVGGGAAGRGDGDAPRRRRCRGPTPDHVDADPRAGRRVLVEPRRHLLGGEHAAVDVEARTRPPPRPPRGCRRAGRAAPGTPGRRRPGAPGRGPRPGGPARARRPRAARRSTSWLSRRLRSTPSRCSRSDSPALPLIWSTCATTPARSPYWLIHLAAVLGPTPGTPGRLSEDSPTSAARSL